MDIRHYINGETIEEPVGFDNLELQIVRGTHHGISAEVSVGSLEFYGNAYGIIKDAYDYDIDKELEYVAIADGETIYTGKIDLSTCSFQEGRYRSVSAKVGEIGTKTIFNNHADTEIDLAGTKTIGGLEVARPAWKKITIPQKHIMYTNVFKMNADRVFDKAKNGWNNKPTFGWSYYSDFQFGFDEMKANEFGQVFSGENFDVCMTGYSGSGDRQVDHKDVYVPESDHGDKFGEETRLVGRLHIECEAMPVTGRQTAVNIKFRPFVSDGEQTVYGDAQTFQEIIRHDLYGQPFNMTFDLDCQFDAEKPFYYGIRGEYLEASASNQYVANYKITIKKASSLRLTMYDNLPETVVQADMLMVHEALNVIASAVTENELTVKSDWYGRPDSWKNTATVIGGGALKAITNGYKIRGIAPDNVQEAVEFEEQRNMPISFKGAFDSLNAIDCIGWGFSTEDGRIYLRVERWDWFYKNNIVLTLDNIASVTTEIDGERVITALKVGYAKYTTNSEYNSIDSIHGERTYTSGVKAIKSEQVAMCDWIADNYAIEETRRAANDVDETEEFKYDENIFVFELVSVTNMNGTSRSYYIGSTATDVHGIYKPSELINAKISPRHNVSRWRSFLFAVNSPTDMKMTSAKVNYRASFKVNKQNYIVNNRLYTELKTFEERSTTAVVYPQAENDDISREPAIFKAEVITFEYPITIAQYRAIRSNPYGLIQANGRKGWIKEITYRVKDGMASFKLIAKNE